MAAATLVVLAVSNGCSGDIDTASLVGEYASVSTAGGVTLSADGTFTASAVPLAVLDDAATEEHVDLSGTWEYLETSGTDFVYLSIHTIEGGRSLTSGVQLYVSSKDAVYFRPDPDGARTIAYDRRTSSERPG